MTTRIKVTLDTDQWEAVYALLDDRLDPEGWIGRQRRDEVRLEIGLAAKGTGEGEPCQCEEVDGE